VTWNNSNSDDLAARRFHLFASDNLIERPIATFYEHIGEQSCYELERSWLVEDHNCVHTFERSENFGALPFWINETIGAFQLQDARITIKADNQDISKSASLLEETDMAGMQQIEAAIRKHNAAPVAFLTAKPQNRFLKSQNLWMQRNSMKAHARIASALKERLVYHAQQARRLRRWLLA
jgi:hypothetical protein